MKAIPQKQREVEKILEKKITRDRRIIGDLLDDFSVKDLKNELKKVIDKKRLEKVRMHMSGMFLRHNVDSIYQMIDEVNAEKKERLKILKKLKEQKEQKEQNSKAA